MYLYNRTGADGPGEEGKPLTVTTRRSLATAHKPARIIYHMLKHVSHMWIEVKRTSSTKYKKADTKAYKKPTDRLGRLRASRSERLLKRALLPVHVEREGGLAYRMTIENPIEVTENWEGRNL